MSSKNFLSAYHIFNSLLIHSDRNFSEDEIIDNSEYIYERNSPRNAEEKVIKFRL